MHDKIWKKIVTRTTVEGRRFTDDVYSRTYTGGMCTVAYGMMK